MLLKLVLLLMHTIGAVFGAEVKHGAGAGPLKKQVVLQSTEQQVSNLGLDQAAGACGVPELMVIIGKLVDDVVALLNCFGLLGGSK